MPHQMRHMPYMSRKQPRQSKPLRAHREAERIEEQAESALAARRRASAEVAAQS